MNAIIKKKQLGQFFTTNSDNILCGFEKFIKNKIVVDPFVGAGDLIQWAKNNKVGKIFGYDIDKKHVDNRKVFLDDVAESKAGEISYGQQKLLTMGCCLANDADLLLLDEPVAGINLVYWEKIITIINEIKAIGKTVSYCHKA